MKRAAAVVMGLVLGASGAMAAEAKAASVTWRELWHAGAPVLLPIDSAPASTTLTFPRVELEEGD